jgi:CHAP domain
LTARATFAVPDAASTATAPTSVVIGTLPGTMPVPGLRGPGARQPSYLAAGPSTMSRLLQMLAQLVGLGRARAHSLTAKDKRILAYLVAALVVAMGGQVQAAAPAEAAAAPTKVPAVVATASVTHVLDLARADIGTVEARNGGTPYHRSYGLPAREPWCAMFVWDVFRRAGGTDSVAPKTAYTPTLANWFRSQGRWTETPAVGAIVFYDWPDNVRRIQHVGIVESFTASTITTIEGNTSPGAAGSQDNGDGVWRRTRERDRYVVGYGLPTYSLR